MAITPAFTFNKVTGSGLATISLVPGNRGDAYLVSTHIASATVHVASLATASVTWTHLGGAVSGTHSFDLWLGVITGDPGLILTTTVTGSAAITSTTNTYTAQLFTAGGQGTTWAVDVAMGTSNNTASSTTITYPSLTPSGAGELYYGYALSGGANALTTGATSGYTVTLDSISNAVIWNTNVSGAQAPTSLQTTSTTSYGLGVVLSATPAAASAIQQASAGEVIVTTGSPLSGWTGTLAVNPLELGDLMLVAGYVASATTHYTALSGGGVTTWQNIGPQFVGTSGTYSMSLWMGVVTTTGSSTITATGSASLSGVNNGMAALELTLHSPAAIWAVDGSVGTLSNASANTVTFPTLTPAVAGELYFGMSTTTADSPTGSPTTGFSSFNNGWNFTTQMLLYNPQLGTGAISPSATGRSASAVSWSMGILIKGTLPSGNAQIRVINQAVNRSRYF